MITSFQTWFYYFFGTQKKMNRMNCFCPYKESLCDPKQHWSPPHWLSLWRVTREWVYSFKGTVLGELSLYFFYKKFKFMQYDIINCKWTPLYCSILNHLESQITQNNKEWITVVLARSSQCGKYHNDNALGPQAFRVVDVIPHIMPISLLVMACVHTT